MSDTLLGLFPRDCMPRTIEEKIVTHADNLIAGSTRVTIDESIASAIHLPKKDPATDGTGLPVRWNCSRSKRAEIFNFFALEKSLRIT